MRFLPFLILALIATTVPTSMAAAPSHLHRMVTKGYATKKPTTVPPTYPPTEAPTTEAPTYPPTEAPTTEAPTYPPTEAPTYPTEAPTTEAPTYPPTEAPTYPPTEAPTTEAPTYYPPTDAPTTSAPTVYYPPTDTPTELPTHPAPTQLTWCHHEIIVSTEHYSVVESDLHDWMNTFLSFFGLDGISIDYLTTSLIPDAIHAPAVGNCTSPYITTIDAYIRITLPNDIYPEFAIRYDQYLVDHPWSHISSTTCGAIVELNETCTNAPTTIVPTTGPTVITTTAPTSKVTSAPTTKTTIAPTNKAPTTKAPTGHAPTQKPTPTQKVNTTKVPTSAPTSSTITITTNVTQPDPNTRCVAGVCITVNTAPTSTHIAIVPIIASIAAMIMAAF